MRAARAATTTTTIGDARARAVRDRGAVLSVERVRADVFVVTTASGRAHAVELVDDGARGRGLVFGDDIGGGGGDVDGRARGPFWCSAALGDASGVVAFGLSDHLVCADVDGDGALTRRRDGRALGPHTGYVRSVVYSRALRRAYSCACNVVPCWIWDDATRSLRATPEREHLTLFTGDVLKLCVFDDRMVFAGVADGTVRAFDVSRPREPKDLGTLGDARAGARGRVVALAVCGDTCIASGSHDGRLEVHDAMDVRSPALARLDISGGKIHAVARFGSYVLVAGDFGVKIIAFNANDSALTVIDDAFAGITTSVRAVAVVDDSTVLIGDAFGSTTLQHK